MQQEWICSHRLAWCRLLTGWLHSDGSQCESVSSAPTSRPYAHWLWLHLKHALCRKDILFTVCFAHVTTTRSYSRHGTYTDQFPQLASSSFFQCSYAACIHKDKSHPSTSWQPLCPNCCSCWCRRLMPQLLFRRRRGLKPFLCQEEKEQEHNRISMLIDLCRRAFSLTGMHKRLWLGAVCKM